MKAIGVIEMDENSNRQFKNLPSHLKPRERLVQLGLEALREDELMAILIGSGTRGENVIKVAGNVLERIKQEPNFNDITVEELENIKGIGRAKAATILAGVELGRRLFMEEKRRSIQIKNPSSVADYYYRKLCHKMKEHFCILLLDTKNRILSEEMVSEGSLNASIVHPREVFKPAIRKSANSIVLIHNHPSGDVQPSREDIEITKRLVKAGEIIGISVLDHIIVGDKNYLSMKEQSYF